MLGATNVVPLPGPAPQRLRRDRNGDLPDHEASGPGELETAQPPSAPVHSDVRVSLTRPFTERRRPQLGHLSNDSRICRRCRINDAR